MHGYHADFDIKRRLYLLAAVVGVSLAWLFYWLVARQLGVSLPWWIESPSVLAFTGIAWWSIEKFFWRAPILRKIEWLYIPNLSGCWTVEICSSHLGFAKTSIANAHIRQTASTICIALDTQQSQSYSVLAALVRTERNSTFELTYLYKNEPKADAVDTMNAHSGTCVMRVSDDLSVLEGEYYSGRGRSNQGKLIFRRTSA